MNISGDYGTELLLRYTEERLARELEERRIADERAAEARRDNGTRLSRFARFFFHEEVAAGGPDWVRPTSSATSAVPAAPSAAANTVAVPDTAAAPHTAPASDAAGAHDDERMLRRELISTRR
jgi:hypothetical protein